MSKIKLIECPRDAMQGIKEFIPTEVKAAYINALLKVGYDTIDFGSFVSPKAIPQMRDTVQVLEKLDLNTDTKLLAIVANERGARDASQFEQISYLGYPFSISETFQLRNTNATIEESLDRVKTIKDICDKSNKTPVIYISMGFGNPYGDEWNLDICHKWVDKLHDLDINLMALSDTIGVATKESISYLFSSLIASYDDIEFGAHFHTTADTWEEKVSSAFDAGCLRFDSTIRGYGGCPMAKNDLVGNMPSEHIVDFFKEDLTIDFEIFKDAMQHSLKVFH